MFFLYLLLFHLHRFPIVNLRATFYCTLQKHENNVEYKFVRFLNSQSEKFLRIVSDLRFTPSKFLSPFVMQTRDFYQSLLRIDEGL